jgi:hypothetical protein
MSNIIPTRRTGRIEGEFVVFLIGMRVNRWWKFWQPFRVALAMTRMQKELAMHPELGLLAQESWFGQTTIMVSYWRSMEHLMAYARGKTLSHMPAWRAFNKQVGTNGDVGIWHETYRSRAGDYESVYVNMPAFGLGKAGAGIDAVGANETAEGRLGQRPSVPAS